MRVSERKKHIRNDLILVAALLLLAAMGAVYLFCFRNPGSLVEVTVDGKLYGTYALSEDRVEEIVTGDQHNRLVIRDGRARVEAADCPDKLCVSHREIFREGESIVCLPHRVVVTVTKGGKP